MHRSRRFLGVSALVLLVAVAPTMPASAQGSAGDFGTLSMPDTAIARNATSSHCASATVSFTSNGKLEDWRVSLESSTVNWSKGPDVLLTEAKPSATITFCTGKHSTGTYVYQGHVQGHLIGQNSYPLGSLSAKIRFGVAQRTPSTLTASVVRSRAKANCPLRKTAHCSKLTGRLRAGGKPIGFTFVGIQAYKRGAWRQQTAARTDGLGRVVWYVTITKKERRTRFRLSYRGSDLTKYAVSRPFRLKY